MADISGARAELEERRRLGERRRRRYEARATQIVDEVGQEPLKGGVRFPVGDLGFGAYSPIDDALVLPPRWIDESDDYLGFEPNSGYFRGLVLHELGHRAEHAAAPAGWWGAMLRPSVAGWPLLIAGYTAAATLAVIAAAGAGMRNWGAVLALWCGLMLALLWNLSLRKRAAEYRADRFAAHVDQAAIEEQLLTLLKVRAWMRRGRPMASVLSTLRAARTHPPTVRRLRRIRAIGTTTPS